MIRRQIAAALFLSACAAFAQNEPARPAFEVASVKLAQPGQFGLGSLRGGPGTSSPGQISGAASLKALIMRAYEMKSYQIDGPAWMASQRCEIVAKVPDGAGKAQVSLMLQSLLAERFHLVAHRETRELPIFALVAGKNGPKFKASATDDRSAVADDEAPSSGNAPKLSNGADGFPDIAPGTAIPRTYEVVVGGPDGALYKLWARREPIQMLADLLSNQLSRPVVDRTGLSGRYDFTLFWALETGGAGIPRVDPPPDEIDMQSAPVMSDPGLSIFTAVQTQLGLKLEPRKGPLEMLVVDRIEKTPTGN